MKEDRDLKELLQNNLMEETSGGFTESVMQRINVASVSAAYTRSLWQDKLFRVLAVAFISISILLLLLNLPLQKISVSFEWHPELPSAFSLQIIQFLLVFWIVMIASKVVSARKYKEG